MKSQTKIFDVDSLSESVDTVGRMITLGRITILFVFMPFLVYVAYREVSDTTTKESVEDLKFKWSVAIALLFNVVFLYQVEKFLHHLRQYIKEDVLTGVLFYYMVRRFGAMIAYMIFKLGFMSFPVEFFFDPKMEIKYLIVYGDYVFTVFITCVFVSCITGLAQSALLMKEKSNEAGTEEKPT